MMVCITTVNSILNINLLLEISLADAELIVMVAFGVHFIKEVSRSQLQSAAKSLLSRDERKKIGHGAEKHHFFIPLAKALLHSGIIELSDQPMKPLTRNNITKKKPF